MYSGEYCGRAYYDNDAGQAFKTLEALGIIDPLQHFFLQQPTVSCNLSTYGQVMSFRYNFNCILALTNLCKTKFINHQSTKIITKS